MNGLVDHARRKAPLTDVSGHEAGSPAAGRGVVELHHDGDGVGV